MTPWSHLDRKLDRAEWASLKEWLVNNPEKRSHLGDGRSDGKRFFSYARGAKAGERWITNEGLASVYERTRAYNRRKWSDPKFKEAERVKAKERRKHDADFAQRERGYKEDWRKRNLNKVAAKERKREAAKRSLIHPNLDQVVVQSIYLQAAELGRQRVLNIMSIILYPFVLEGGIITKIFRFFRAMSISSKMRMPFGPVTNISTGETCRLVCGRALLRQPTRA